MVGILKNDSKLFSKYENLGRKIIFTVLMLSIYRFGSYIPLPSINPNVLMHITSENSSGVLGMFNMLSGGSLGRMSIFSLAIMPYITSSIIIQLFSIIYKNLEQLKKEGESGRKKINQYTRYITVLLASVQAYGIAISAEKITFNSIPLVENAGSLFKLITVITLTSGTIFLMWLGEQVTSKGLGNGTSLIIFSGIVAGLPSSVINMFELSRSGSISSFSVLITIAMTFIILCLIVFIEKSQRNITVQYPKRQMGNKIYTGETSHIPLKLNTSGVIPPIFASSILLFPLTVAKLPSISDIEWIHNIVFYLDHGKFLYIILYCILIVFFSFFYTAIIFNSEETADNLKKHNGFILGRRPGKNTADFFDYVLSRITVIGAIYIAFICAFPEIMIAKYSIPFYLSGTSVLIIVNVVIDTLTQIKTHLFANQYESLIKKAKLKEKRN